MHTVYILHTVSQKVFIGALGIKNSFRKSYFGNYKAKNHSIDIGNDF